MTWYNDGLNDGPAPLIAVHSTNTTFSTTPGGDHDRTGLTFLGIAMDGGPAGVLRPGAMESLRLFAFALDLGGTEPLDWYAARQPVPDDSEPFNWDYIRPLLRDEIAPATMYEAQFQTIFVQFAQQTGGTNHDFLAMLSRNATLLPWSPTVPVSLRDAVALEFRRAWAATGSSISGDGLAADVGLGISGRAVGARLMDTAAYFVTFSLADGSFIFETVPPGSYELDFEDAWVRQGASATVTASQPLTGVLLELDAGGAITGVVRAQETGHPIPDAVVSVWSVADARVVSAASDGSFAFKALPTETYELEVKAKERAPMRLHDLFIDHTSLSLNVNLLPSGSIMGQARVEPYVQLDQPLIVIAQSVAEGVAPTSHLADVAGLSYVLHDLPEGAYELTFVHPELVTHRTGPVAVATGQVVQMQELVLTKGASIAGTVVSRVPAVPAHTQHIGVFHHGALMQIVRAEDSEFRVGRLAAGEYRLRALGLDEGLSIDATVSLNPGQEQTGVELQIVQGATIAGVVTNSSTGQPLAGLDVVVAGPDGARRTAWTNANGVYSVGMLGPGQHEVGPGTPGAAATQTVTVTNLDGGLYTANWALTPVASITGHLLLGDGAHVGGGAVTLRHNGHDVVVALAGEDGGYGLLLLQSGRYELQAAAPDVSFAPVSIDVVTGVDRTIDIRAGDASITLAVDDPAGPLTDASLVLYQVLANFVLQVGSATLDESEQVVFSHLAPGAYRVDVQAAANRGNRVTFTFTPGRQESMTVSVAVRATLTGTVRSAEDQPIQHAQVWLYPAGWSQPVSFGFTSADGQFSLPYLAPGAYDLVVLADGYAAPVQSITVTGDVSLTVELAPSAATLSGRALDAFAQPIAGATVTVLDAAGHVLGEAQTDATGEFQITTAMGTGLTVRLACAGCAAVEVQGIVLLAGQTLDLPDRVLPALALARDLSGGAALLLQAQPSAQVPWASLFRLWALSLNSPQIGLMGAPGGPIDSGSPTFGQVILQTLGDHDRHANEKTEDDVAECPEKCKPRCDSYHQQLLNSIKSQQTWWELVEEWEDIVDRGVNIALGVWASEAVTNFCILYSALLIGYGIAATWSSSAMAALNASAGTTVLYGKVLGYINAALSILGSIGVTWWNARHSTEPLTTAQSVEAGGGMLSSFFSAVDGMLFTLKNWSSTAASSLRGSIIGIVAMAFSWRSIWDSFTFANTSAACVGLGSDFNSYKFAWERYNSVYYRIDTQFIWYNECLKLCKDDPNDGEDSKVPIKGTLDPNDITGPNGYGDERWVSPSTPLLYTIRFENDPLRATGLVRSIQLTQALDPDLDPRSFRLVDIGIGTHRFILPKNTSQHYARLDLTADLGVYLEIAAGIDVATGEVYWNLTAIDPNTGLVPIDPFLGLLPPNTEAPLGQGWVTYTVQARTDAPTNSAIEAQATIVFDQNEPIDTPVFVNLLDSAAPSSAVQALPPEIDTAQFQVSWSGQDDADGSSLASFSVYVSDSGQPFTLWIADAAFREAPFAGQPGHTYAFYSVARDNAGNIERPPAAHDAVTLVTGATSSLGDFVWLDRNGKFDVSEPSQRTNSQGAYRFTDLHPGRYIVAVSMLGGWVQTAPGESGWTDPGGPAGWDFAAGEFIMAGSQELKAAAYSVPTIADWNNDGRPDLIVGELSGSAGKVRVYLNSGTAQVPEFNTFFYAQANGQDLTVPAAGCLGAAPRVADWDRDGRKDLVVGLASGAVQVFINNNTDVEPGFGPGVAVVAGPTGAKTAISVGARAVPELVDWNNDGCLDLMVGALDGKVRLYLNDASTGAPDLRSALTIKDGGQDLVVPSGRSSPAMADLDHDGGKDLVIGNTDGELHLFLNTGTDANPSSAGSHRLTAAGAPIRLGTSRARPFIADVDGDGVLDLLVGGADGFVRRYEQVSVPGGEPARPYTRSVYVASDEAQQEVDFGFYRPNRAPTLSTVHPLTGARERTPFSITYEMVAAAANESDPDGDSLWFRIEAVLAGTLEEDGAPVVPGQTLLGAGESLRWQPPAAGTISAYSIRAWDGELASATAVQVRVVVNKLPPPPPPIARGIEVLYGARSVGGAAALAEAPAPSVATAAVDSAKPIHLTPPLGRPAAAPANLASEWTLPSLGADEAIDPLKVGRWKSASRDELRLLRTCISLK